MLNKTVILLIDDDVWMQKVLTKVIAKLEINTIYNATDGFTGVNLAIEKKPDIIFLDLMMPDIDGLITLKMLKSINIIKDIPVVIITSNSDFESIGAVLNAGATDFVAKPFSFTTIQEKIIKVLTESEKGVWKIKILTIFLMILD
jgi:CheY-like chemotaxis protein